MPSCLQPNPGTGGLCRLIHEASRNDWLSLMEEFNEFGSCESLLNEGGNV